MTECCFQQAWRRTHDALCFFSRARARFVSSAPVRRSRRGVMLASFVGSRRSSFDGSRLAFPRGTLSPEGGSFDFLKNRWPLCERRAHSGLESEENFGGDSDETPEHFGGLLAELSLRHGKQRTHLGKTSRLEMATKKFV